MVCIRIVGTIYCGISYVHDSNVKTDKFKAVPCIVVPCILLITTGCGISLVSKQNYKLSSQLTLSLIKFISLMYP